MGAAIQNLGDAFHDYTQTSVEMQNVAGAAGLPLPELVPWFFGIRDRTTRAFINLEFLRTNKFPMTSDGIIHGAFPWVMDGVNAMGGLHVEYGGEDLDPGRGKPYTELKGIRQRYVEQRDAMIARLEAVPIPEDALEPPAETKRRESPQQPKAPERKSYEGYVASLPPRLGKTELDSREAVLVAKAQLAQTDKEAEGEAIIASVAKADPSLAAMLRSKWKKRRAEAVQGVDANG